MDSSWILNSLDETAEELAWDHRMDISASVHTRMLELGISKSDLAKMLGVDKSQVTRLIKGKRNLTLQTIAEIEAALHFRLDAGFKYYSHSISQRSVTSVVSLPNGIAEQAANQSANWKIASMPNTPVQFKMPKAERRVAA